MLVSGPLLLGGPVLAAAGRQGLDQFATAAPPCAPGTQATPAVPRDATYRAGAPVRSALATAGQAGTPLHLDGTVTGLTCGRVEGAQVDLWQADARGVYDTTGFTLRGRQVTDADGRFHFDTIVPGAAGSRAPHLGVRVQVPGKADFSTELFFPDSPRNARDPRFRSELLLTKVRADRGQGAIFDIVLDI